MSTTFVGTTFQRNSEWHQDEVALCANIRQQIDAKWPAQKNLLINTTWFGPQFNNGQWELFEKITAQTQFNQLFILASVDPACLNTDQITAIADRSGATQTYLLGNFDSQYQFSFIATLLPRYFANYSIEQCKLQQVRYRFLNYNRKPRTHRVELIEVLKQRKLLGHGLVSLGRGDPTYNNGHDAILLGEQPADYAGTGNWNLSMDFGVPHDIHSLGNMDIWRSHFLNIVSETEFLPWDPMFITEKTWKPMIGLRPFVLNGQPKIYSYLRDQGFRTFEQYWPVDVQNVTEQNIHSRIADLLDILCAMSAAEVQDLYSEMWADLLHNRARFLQYAEEQQHRYCNLFND